MNKDKQEKEILEKAIAQWEKDGLLTTEKGKELRQTIDTKNENDIARYFFFIAISCTVLAFGAIFIDEKLLEKIKTYFSLSNIIISIITACLSVAWFWYIRNKKKTLSLPAYEAYMVPGALAALISLIYICKDIGEGPGYSTFLALAALVLFVLSVAFRSSVLWVGFLAAVMGWYGAFSTWQSNSSNLFLGMNYPVRFTIFGLLILLLSFIQLRFTLFTATQRITFIAGLVIFFTGMWGVSIFGNYGTLDEWFKVRQLHVLAYSIVFAFFAVLCFYLGIKYKDSAARDFGILFILINLYTRYFEYFWDTLNKGLFFLVLAITFGLLGRWLERKRKKGIAQGNIN